MDLGLKGKRAVVLAASKGLGYAMAKELAAEGARLVITSGTQANVDAAAKEIAAATGAEVIPMAADMADPDNMDRVYERAAAAFGGVDILVNNHGGPPVCHAYEVEEAQLYEQFTICVVSIIRLCKLVLPGMRERKWGRILTVGAASMIQPLPYKGMDNIMRGAVVGYTKALSNEVAKDGVTVNIIMPGTLVTDRVRSSNELTAARMGITVDDWIRQRLVNIPAGRFGDLEDFGAMAAFLCSTRANYMTGAIWRVDGGQVKSIG